LESDIERVQLFTSQTQDDPDDVVLDDSRDPHNVAHLLGVQVRGQAGEPGAYVGRVALGEVRDVRTRGPRALDCGKQERVVHEGAEPSRPIDPVK
jgi:hypothetical protein